jgi:hypothetical protein
MSRTERDLLAAQWRRASMQELTRAVAFGDLACRLRRRRAPLELVKRCDAVADQALGSARRCLELASRFAGHDVVAGPLRRPRCRPMRRATALARLVERATALREPADWYAAWLADQHMRRGGDAEVGAVLAALRADDGRRDLCADVIAWCVAGEPLALQDLAGLYR